MLRARLFALSLALGLGATTGAAIEICNGTDSPAYAGDERMRLWVAVGYAVGDNWFSEGWWKLEPGDCKTAVSQRSGPYYYSVFEENIHSGRRFQWPGEYAFCTRNRSYDKRGASDCAGEFEKTAFFTSGSKDLRAALRNMIVFENLTTRELRIQFGLFKSD